MLEKRVHHVSRYLGNVQLNESKDFQLANSEDRHSLTIRETDLHHAGLYTVKAMNPAGEVSATASLHVNGDLFYPF